MITVGRINTIELFYVQREMPSGVWISLANRLESYEQAKAFAAELDNIGALRIIMESTDVYVCEDGT